MTTNAIEKKAAPGTSSKISLQALVFAFVAVVTEGLQPVISNARPAGLDPLFFSWMTVFWELLIILPFYLLERRKLKLVVQAVPRVDSPRHYWKSLLFVGFAFSMSVYLMIVGYEITGSITGIIIVKTSPFFAMIFGALYLQERITLSQVGFTLILLAGVYVLATKGTFQVGTFSVGVVLLLIVPFLWNFAHAVTKPLLEKHIMTTPETILSRMILCTIFLGIFCLAVRGTQDFSQWGNPASVWSMFLMGAVYACLHFTWYKLITTVQLSIATAIMMCSPLATMFAAFVTGTDVLQWYHVVSLVICFIGLYGIIALQNRNRPTKNYDTPTNIP